MAQNLFVIRVPDSANVAALRQRIVTAITTHYGYQPVLPDGTPNPQTPAQFTQAWIVDRIKDEVRKHDANAAERVARASAVAAVDTEMELS